jgi:hypothetical protein
MDDARTGTHHRLFILKAGAFAALLAALTSACLIAVMSALQPIVHTTPLSVWDVVKATFLLLPITLVSCGSYGFLAGIIGTLLLKRRRVRIRSSKRLLVESAVVGFILGFPFPVFDRLMNPPSLNGMQMLLSAPIATVCAVLCAMTFRAHLVTAQA